MIVYNNSEHKNKKINYTHEGSTILNVAEFDIGKQ